MSGHEPDTAPQPTESVSSRPTETLWRSKEDPKRYGALLRLLFDPEPAPERSI
jgi:hypothetical protein